MTVPTILDLNIPSSLEIMANLSCGSFVTRRRHQDLMLSFARCSSSDTHDYQSCKIAFVQSTLSEMSVWFSHQLRLVIYFSGTYHLKKLVTLTVDYLCLSGVLEAQQDTTHICHVSITYNLLSEELLFQ